MNYSDFTTTYAPHLADMDEATLEEMAESRRTEMAEASSDRQGLARWIDRASSCHTNLGAVIREANLGI